MLKTCEEDQICTIHMVVTFKQRPVKEKEIKSEFQNVEKSLYQISTRNRKTDKNGVNTLLKKDLSHVIHINIADLDKLLDNKKDAFAEEKRQIGTTHSLK